MIDNQTNRQLDKQTLLLYIYKYDYSKLVAIAETHNMCAFRTNISECPVKMVYTIILPKSLYFEVGRPTSQIMVTNSKVQTAYVPGVGNFVEEYNWILDEAQNMTKYRTRQRSTDRKNKGPRKN